MAEEKKKSRVDDINRSVYDIKDEVEFSYKADRGLTEDIIRKISTEKEEPAWMLGKASSGAPYLRVSRRAALGARYF